MISSTLKVTDGGQVTIYPDFVRRCILLWENVEIIKLNNTLRS